MRRWLKRTLEILDGVPAENPSPSPASPGRRAGQSLVEMVFITPLLLIMFAGLIEIGWLAGNFLVLLDVSREAGRFGAQLDPTQWTYGDELNVERMDCDVNHPLKDYPTQRDPVNLLGDVFLPADDADTRLVGPTNYNYVNTADVDIGYYDGVACTLLRNMDPLRFDAARDDIVVSVFSYVVHNTRDTDTDPPEVIVTGRYPPRTNECSGEPDPFDWNHNGNPDEWTGPASDGEDIYGYDAGSDNVRGFIMTGHHVVSDTPGCLGSEFSTAEVQSMLNEMAPLEIRNFPNNGMVLVELFWHHDQLLNLPFFTVFGNGFELNVWSVFAATAAEPTQTPSAP